VEARIEVPHAELALDQEGILWQHLRGGRIDLKAAVQIMPPTMQLAARSPHDPKPMVSFTTDVTWVTREARAYFAQYEPDNPDWLFDFRTAVMTQNAVERVIAQFFLGLNKLSRRSTVKIFTDREKALDWLREGR